VAEPSDVRARRAADAGGAWHGDPLDGRLDLDRLDDPHDPYGSDPLDLDVLGDDDGPLLSERVRDWLERRGMLGWVRRHRPLAGLAAGVAALSLVAAGGWWAAQPDRLADEARVEVTTSGQEPARLIVDVSTGHITGLTQLVLVTSSEAPSVSVDALGVVGPGLSRTTARIPTSVTGAPTTGAVAADISCDLAEDTDAVVASRAGDYRVRVQRTDASTGEQRIDTVPLVGAEEWLRDVRKACVQIAADRDLQVRRVEASQVPGQVAADIRMLVANRADRPWRSVRVSTLGAPSVVAATPDVDIPAGSQEWVTVRLWPDDCAAPVRPLAQGVPLRAALEEGIAVTESRAPTFYLPLTTGLDAVAAALRQTCTAAPPTATITKARVSGSSIQDGAGTIDIWIDVQVPPGSVVEVQEPLADRAGVVRPFEDVVAVGPDGVAQVRVQWEVPGCFAMLQAGPPVLSVRVASDLRRPYRLPLTGEAMRTNLVRLCGTTAGSVVA
jgi:hypothetical protein